MLRLVLKDFVAAEWILLAWIPLYAVQLAGVATVPPALLIITVLSTAGLAFGSIGLEEIQGTERLWCSLPVSRRDIVLARYLATASGIFIGLGTSLAVALVARSWLFTAAGDAAAFPGVGAYAVLASFFLCNAALLLPCYFRLGAGRGLILYIGLTFGLIVMVSAIGWALAHLAGGPDVVEALRMRDPEQLAAARAWIGKYGDIVSGGLAAVAIALFGISAALSVSFYSNRDC